ncbi:MAG TPA: IS1380 family transposase [Acidimicrobiales bacterium]|nr:IS1380 family transposase [Acidimicrobiales bacterium]
MQRNARRPNLTVTTGGHGVVAHAGARLLCEVADALGLTEGLSGAMAPTKTRHRGYDRGEVLLDLAVAIADGATSFSDLRVLADQPALFGAVASVPTAWRTAEATDADALGRIAVARAEARKRAWAAGTDPGFYVIDIDATLVGAHSEKEGAAPTYKRGFGFQPMVAFLDATGEPLAGLLRPGNAAAWSAEDQVAVLDAALAQLPVDPEGHEVIARTDTAGASHGFVDGCRERGVRFVVGFQLTAALARLILEIPEKRWVPTVSADGTEEREVGEVAEITDLADLSRWPDGTRMLVRREEPHPGAQLTFTDVDGRRYQVFITDHPDHDVAFLEALYRGRGRAERRICDLKDTGLANLPSASFAINEVWLMLVLIAGDLLAWTKSLCLDGPLSVAEPKRLRYTLLHSAGLLVRSARRTTLRIAEGWPWADDLVAAFGRLPGWALAT